MTTWPIMIKEIERNKVSKTRINEQFQAITETEIFNLH